MSSTADEPLIEAAAQTELRRALDSLKSRVFDAAPIGLCVLRDGRPQLINNCFAEMLGGVPQQHVLLAPQALQQLWPTLWPQLIGLDSHDRRVSVPLALGAVFRGQARAQPLRALGSTAELVTLTQDQSAQGVLFSSDWHARMLEQAETMGRSGSAEIDLDSGRAVISQGLQTLLGQTFHHQSISGWRLLRWVPKNERGYVASIWRAAITDEPFEFQHRILRKDGTRLEMLHRGMVEANASGHRHGYLIVQDITAQKEAEHRIQELANHDEVTGLANRSQLLDKIDAAVHGARWDPRSFILISIQVDQVDHLKQAMGYGAGDAMAMAVAARLCGLAHPEDTIARVDGGEFAMLIHPDHCVKDPTGALRARQIVQVLAQPERLGAAEIVPGARLGVAQFPTDADAAGLLLEAAQTARLGIVSSGEQVAFFTPATRAAALRRLSIESGLRHARERSELELQFQLQADLMTGEAIGAEVLLCWNSATLGPVPATEFMPVASQTGLIVMLGDWQREMACRQLRAWEDAGLRGLRLALNLSALELQQPDIMQRVQQTLTTYGLAPQALGLEISEQALVTGSSQMGQTLAQLRASGIEIALDDFGSGYSNLSLLRSLPVDVIKVHRSCVPDVTAATGDVSLTRAIINMAHSLQIKVLAEGVETTGQLTLLVANGCDRMQGTVFSAPMDAQALTQMRQGPLHLPGQFMRPQRERTLLLVDDEPSIVSALKRLFRRDGYRIVTAHSGVEGLQRMAEYDADVVLSDQRMPGMTGVEFLRRVKELYPDTVRMVLSGYTELQSITDAINEGAIYRFLTKPWDDERLRLHVQEAFRHKGMGDENKRLASQVVSANEALAQVNEQLEQVLDTQQQQIDREKTSANAAHDMVDLLPVPMLGLDSKGIVVIANQEAHQIFSSPSTLLGRPIHAVLELPANLNNGDVLEEASLPKTITLQGKRWSIKARLLANPLPCGLLIALTEVAQAA